MDLTEIELQQLEERKSVVAERRRQINQPKVHIPKQYNSIEELLAHAPNCGLSDRELFLLKQKQAQAEWEIEQQRKVTDRANSKIKKDPKEKRTLKRHKWLETRLAGKMTRKAKRKKMTLKKEEKEEEKKERTNDIKPRQINLPEIPFTTKVSSLEVMVVESNDANADCLLSSFLIPKGYDDLTLKRKMHNKHNKEEKYKLFRKIKKFNKEELAKSRIVTRERRSKLVFQNPINKHCYIQKWQLDNEVEIMKMSLDNNDLPNRVRKENTKKWIIKNF